jgi:serine protease Do
MPRTSAFSRIGVPVLVLCLGLPLPAQKAPLNPAAQDPKSTAPQAGAGTSPEPSSEPVPILRQLNSALEGLVAKVSPAVVQIVVSGYGPANDDSHAETALIVRQHALGSGIIVDPDGYIMTNAHVVEGAQRIRVALPLPSESAEVAPIGRRRIVDARLLGIHKDTDLALLKIDQTNLPVATLATARGPQEGELVVAIGSPEGLQNSVTLGVVSSVARQPDLDKPMVYIQTDAPINPGNSGGPLVDTQGYVIGLNTFILSQSGGSEGLGFAIPARIVNFVYRSLRKYGHVHRIEIGAIAQTIGPDLADGLDLPQSWGVIISDVIPGGPAEAAGLKIKDIVLAADGRRVVTLSTFSAALYLHPLDQLLKLEVLRGKEKKVLYIPAIEHRDRMDQLMDAVDPEKSLIPRLGILAIDLTDPLRSMVPDLRVSSGVVVVGRAADLTVPETGLTTGDVIHSLNNTPIDSAEQLRTLVRQLEKSAPVVLQVERAGQLQYLAFEMD